MIERTERKKQFGLIHAQARIKAGKSQEYMAEELYVSRKTIQNWERGFSSPSFFQSLEWFRVLNQNPFPYYLRIVFHDQLIGLSNNEATENDNIEENFNKLMAELPISEKRSLLYLFYGDHGSSANAVLQLLLAHLHLPMKDRVATATIIVNMYEMEKELCNLICPDNIQPDLFVLNEAIHKGKTSAIHNENAYGVVEKDSKEGME